MRLVGQIVTVVVWATLAGWLARAVLEQRVAHRKGAHLAPHRRRGRVPCSRCGRFMWTDHAWQGPTAPELYCSPACVPNPQEGPTP